MRPPFPWIRIHLFLLIPGVALCVIAVIVAYLTQICSTPSGSGSGGFAGGGIPPCSAALAGGEVAALLVVSIVLPVVGSVGAIHHGRRVPGRPVGSPHS